MALETERRLLNTCKSDLNNREVLCKNPVLNSI